MTRILRGLKTKYEGRDIEEICEEYISDLSDEF
jgi:hypothetical protein